MFVFIIKRKWLIFEYGINIFKLIFIDFSELLEE